MKYLLMDPPFEIVDFADMNKKEANQHFEWYIDQIPVRIKMLKDAYESTGGGNSIGLDFSKSSLIKLWSWYLTNVEIVQKSNKDLELEYRNSNEMTKYSIRPNKISRGWIAVAIDISIYFSECMINMHDNLKWGIISNPKSLMHVNKPVVVGFKNNMAMDSSNLLFIQTRKILRGIRNENALLNLFENWEQEA